MKQAKFHEQNLIQTKLTRRDSPLRNELQILIQLKLQKKIYRNLTNITFLQISSKKIRDKTSKN